MKLAIASGKGGTGKTTLAVNLALSLEGRVQLLDCDVEEPNCHLFVDPDWSDEEPVTVPSPVLDADACRSCGACADFCRYNALAVVGGELLTFPELCHSCGGCLRVCPEHALSEEPRRVGMTRTGTIGDIAFTDGTLDVGEARAAPVIEAVKKKADPKTTTIVDAPPGASCSVIDAVTGCDYCVLVTEPTPFGLADLAVACELMGCLDIPHGVVVNRDGIGDGRVDAYCDEHGIPVHLRIPDDPLIARAYARGIPFTCEQPEYATLLADLFESIKGDLP